MENKIGYVPKNLYVPETVNVKGLIKDEAAQNAGIEVIEVVLPGGRSRPFAFVYYLEHRSKQVPIRFDTDKVAFMDHFEDKTKEHALASVASRLVDVLNNTPRKNGFRRSIPDQFDKK